MAARPRHASRWKEDWEELELLVCPMCLEGSTALIFVQGRGAFGSVVKARNKMDSRIYAGTCRSRSISLCRLILRIVKKIRLRTSQSDQKIFREVDTLSRLNHRYIVRYYTTWIETSDHVSTATSTVGSSAGTSIPHHGPSESEEESDPFAINFDELDDGYGNNTPSHASFPAITFTRSGTPRSDEGESGSDSDGTTSGSEDGSGSRESEGQMVPTNGRASQMTKRAATPVPSLSRTLYIQMVRTILIVVEQVIHDDRLQEYVERQTLKEVSIARS